MSNLDELRLNDNKMKTVGANIFKMVEISGSLCLNGNYIEKVDVKAFENLIGLRILKLNNNRLKQLDRRCFEPLKAIQCIELYENDCDLKSLSFLSRTLKFDSFEYDRDKLNKYGFNVDLGEFLKQLPEIG